MKYRNYLLCCIVVLILSVTRVTSVYSYYLEPDKNYGSNGVFTSTMPGISASYSYHYLQQDGSLFNIGSLSNGSVSMQRVTPEGQYDNSLLRNGTREGTFGKEGGQYVIQIDNKYLIVSTSSSGFNKSILRRHNYDGTFDKSFNRTGYFYFEPSQYPYSIDTDSAGIKVVPDGNKYVFLFYSTHIRLPYHATIYIARLLQDGSLDKSFNGTGISYVDYPQYYSVTGDIIVTGTDNYKVLLRPYDVNTRTYPDPSHVLTITDNGTNIKSKDFYFGGINRSYYFMSRKNTLLFNSEISGDYYTFAFRANKLELQKLSVSSDYQAKPESIKHLPLIGKYNPPIETSLNTLLAHDNCADMNGNLVIMSAYIDTNTVQKYRTVMSIINRNDTKRKKPIQVFDLNNTSFLEFDQSIAGTAGCILDNNTLFLTDYYGTHINKVQLKYQIILPESLTAESNGYDITYPNGKGINNNDTVVILKDSAPIMQFNQQLITDLNLEDIKVQHDNQNSNVIVSNTGNLHDYNILLRSQGNGYVEICSDIESFTSVKNGCKNYKRLNTKSLKVFNYNNIPYLLVPVSGSSGVSFHTTNDTSIYTLLLIGISLFVFSLCQKILFHNIPSRTSV